MIESVLRASFNGVLATILSPLYWIASLMVYASYRREFSREITGRLWIRSVGEGMIAGIVVMMMTTGLGLFMQPDPVLLWMGPAAWSLSLVHRRFFCFSYGAAMVIALCWSVRRSVDSAGVVAMVGMLHGVEGALVWYNGRRGRIGKIVQHADALQWEEFFVRFWPIPVGIMLETTGVAGGTMPIWWPIWGSPEITVGGILGLSATLGYSERDCGKNACRRSGGRIMLYGGVLMLLAVAARSGGYREVMAVLFMVLGHEWIGRR